MEFPHQPDYPAVLGQRVICGASYSPRLALTSSGVRAVVRDGAPQDVTMPPAGATHDLSIPAGTRTDNTGGGFTGTEARQGECQCWSGDHTIPLQSPGAALLPQRDRMQSTSGLSGASLPHGALRQSP